MSFDFLARHYRWMEVLLAGGKLQRCRIRFLSQVMEAKEVLIVGEGNGRFLAEFLSANKIARVTCIDFSRKMLELAQARISTPNLNSQRVCFVHADILTWRPTVNYDLIITHFLLDCFTPDQLQTLVRTLSNAILPHGSWLLADFSEATTGLAKIRSRIILAMMYCFFRVTTKLPAKTLASPDIFLRENGLILQQRETFEWGLLHSDLWRKQN